MIIAIPPIVTFPARPINGGPLLNARPKRGSWAVEPKVNGWRALVHVPSGTMWNRHGEKLSIASAFAPALEKLRATLPLAGSFEWADCEALERRHGIGRGSLIVLDAIPDPPHREAPYTRRRLCLEPALAGCLRPDGIAADSIYLIPSFPAQTIAELWLLTQTLNAEAGCEFYEGVVSKRTTAPYPRQLLSATRETADWVKHRWHF